MSDNPRDAGTTNAGNPRETFAETLAAVAAAAHTAARLTPPAEIGALRRRRRTRRAALAGGLAAVTTCSVALGVSLAASPTAKPPSLPPVGPTPTIAVTPSLLPPTTASTSLTSATPTTQATASGPTTSTPTSTPASTPTSTSASTATPPPAKPPAGVPIPARYLPPQELPQASTFLWSSTYVTTLHLQEPLPTTCNNPLGTEITHGVEQVSYSSTSGPEKITETIYDFGTPTAAANRLAAITPTCGTAGFTVHTADGFGWTEPQPAADTTDHLIIGRHGKWIAVLEYLQAPGRRVYDSSHDGDVLKTMVDRL